MSQKTRAIVVGVDGYAFSPLASAVNDAVAICAALTQPVAGELRGLVATTDLTLLASPAGGQAAPPGSLPATRDAILGALEALYNDTETADRLIFYFAGHGLSASRDGRVRESLIVPVDVSSSTDGRNMICLDDLLALFAERGPLQQLWIVDACRDMPYEKRPRAYEIEWNDQPPQGPRAQAAIFAVAAGGQAQSQQGGHGRFTTHLLAGLCGEGSAADYVPARGHCVTAPSLHAYVQRRILKSLEGYDDWTRTVQAPEMRTRGPLLEPLRLLLPPLPRAFSVDVRPPEAQAVIDLALELQTGFPVPGWPPLAPPRVYELRADLKRGMDELGWGEPRPALLAVDLREDDRATIEVPRGTVARRGTATAPEPQPYRVTTDLHGVTGLVTASRSARSQGTPGAAAARLRVEVADSAAGVRLRRAEHPWTVREHEPANQALELEPGIWDVQTLLGDEVISATRVVLTAGQERVVSSVAQITPSLATLLPPQDPGASDETPRTVMPSETIGPMQGAILPTLLPLLALKPFDAQNVVLRQLGHLQIPLLDPGVLAAGMAPHCAVAVAMDGSRPPAHSPEVAQGLRWWASGDGRVSVHVLGVDPHRASVRVAWPGAWADVAAPQLAGGVTAVAVTVRADGTVQATVGLYRLPLGLAWPQPWGDGQSFPPGRLARALALAAPLFSAGADLRAYPANSLDEFAMAKWIDPVLGALAFHSCRSQLRAMPTDADPGRVASLLSLRDTIQANMTRHFGSLPDCRIIAALHDDPEHQRQEMATLLADAALGQPVLTASLADLADAARTAALQDHWSLDRIERIAPGHVFNVVVMPTAAS